MPDRHIQNFNELIERWRVDALEFLRHDVPKILLILIVTLVLVRLLRAATQRLRQYGERRPLPSGLRRQQLNTIASVAYSAGTFVLSFIALLQVLGVLNINIGPLLASAGIAGLAIGFGAQTLVRDVINGFFILMENQFEVGDVIRVGGITGTVENMTLRKTLVRDDQGALATIPNGEIKVVQNLTRDWAQVTMHVSVSYQEDSERVIELLKQVALELKNDPQWADSLVGDPQVPGIDRVSGHEVDYAILVKTRPGTQFAVTRELRRRIKDCLQKNNIQPGGPGGMFAGGVGIGPKS